MTWLRPIGALVPAVALITAGLATPTTADAAGGVAGAPVRHFDSGLLDHTNQAREHHNRRQFTMNRHLWSIAHSYAKHLAKTGRLSHNPRLVHKLDRACPSWGAVGENVGVETGRSPGALFRAYMHSPEHRANILDHNYTQVGIASVQVTRHGKIKNYNVIDFANHCPA